MKLFKWIPCASIATLLLGVTAIGGGKAAADQVFSDDVIVQGSLCVGLDCVNNESFGFDTIILKENNLRIFFNDTSVLAGFPTNDWRVVINDSASGGANFFAIEDSTATRQVFKVSAGARANSIFASSSGNIGFGTSTPVLVTHAFNGNTPGHRLEQDGSLGFPPYTWDVAGNEANFFIRDVTGGSRLPFRIRPGAPTSSVDIGSTGNVGIGTASPARKLDVQQTVDSVTTGVGVLNTAGTKRLNLWVDANNVARVDGGGGDTSVAINGSSTGNVGIGTTTPGAQLHTTAGVRFAGVANCASGIQSNGSGDLSCLASSRQFKNIAGDLAPAKALANVMALRPQVGVYKTTPDEPEHWLIAEDVATVDPALAGYKDGKPYTVKTQNIVADLVAVIQQQQRRIEALEKAVAR
jgi:hypothetical protein